MVRECRVNSAPPFKKGAKYGRYNLGKEVETSGKVGSAE